MATEGHSPEIDLQSNIQVRPLRCSLVDRMVHFKKPSLWKITRASRRSDARCKWRASGNPRLAWRNTFLMVVPDANRFRRGA